MHFCHNRAYRFGSAAATTKKYDFGAHALRRSGSDVAAQRSQSKSQSEVR